MCVGAARGALFGAVLSFVPTAACRCLACARSAVAMHSKACAPSELASRVR